MTPIHELVRPDTLAVASNVLRNTNEFAGALLNTSRQATTYVRSSVHGSTSPLNFADRLLGALGDVSHAARRSVKYSDHKPVNVLNQMADRLDPRFQVVDLPL